METIRSYKALRESIQWDKTILDLLRKDKNFTAKDIDKIREAQEKRQKESARDFYRYVRKNYVDPFSVPLRNNEKQWRSVSDDNGDSRTDFIIIPDIWGDLWETEEGYSQINEDIEELVFSTVGYRSMYDFPTGHIVTYTWGFKRVPCGVAVVHTCGIDW